MNIATQITGERISQAVAERAAAEETLALTERGPSAFLVALNVFCFSLSAFFLFYQFGTRLAGVLGALASAAFVLALTSYGNGLRHQRRLEAMLCLMRKSQP